MTVTEACSSTAFFDPVLKQEDWPIAALSLRGFPPRHAARYEL
jgi:hypothetical protein